jgi:Na+-transporting NADH:ubiquinone oxidoreductase subunit NqrC
MRDAVLARWLAPLAALTAGPVAGTTYFTVEQAQALFFPGEKLTPVALQLTSEQAKAIEKASGTRVRERAVRVWKAQNGWFYVDQVIGKHELITYALAVGADGAVVGLEILDYRETYGGEVRDAKWRQQFVGKKNGAPLTLEVDIVNLSGATLSSRNVTVGVRRLLATHELVTLVTLAAAGAS